jgi:hypothetical protein
MEGLFFMRKQLFVSWFFLSQSAQGHAQSVSQVKGLGLHLWF